MLKKLTLIISIFAMALVLCSSVSAIEGTEQINLNTTGGQPNGDSLNPVISADGNYIAFSSDASNLVTNDTNGKSDIFVYNNLTKGIERVSVDSSNVQSHGNSYNPSISSDGRYVVFDSVADNLVPDDTNLCSDIFIRDTLYGTTNRIPFSSTILQLTGNSYNPSISGDGRYIVYEFYNTILAGSYGPSSIFLYDRLLEDTIVISSGSGINPIISADGNHIVYQDYYIWLYDRINNEKSIVSIDPYGIEANGPSYNPSINADGTVIAFQSSANNLCSCDTAGNTDVFVRDLRDPVHPKTLRISVNSNKEQANGSSFNPSVSGTGRYITYYSSASNLVSGDNNGVSDVFYYDMETAKTFLVSVNSNGEQFSSGSYLPSISSTGRYVTFLSKQNINTGYSKVLARDCEWNVNTNIASGNYYEPQSIALTANNGTRIFYTTDGSNPTTSSLEYSSPININTSKTLKYIAVDAASNQSPVNSRTYQIYAWEPYSYQVTIPYRLSNKKYRIKYTVPYTAKKKIRTKVGKKWKYKYIYVTKYKTKYRWDYRYGYSTETRWAYHWVLK